MKHVWMNGRVSAACAFLLLGGSLLPLASAAPVEVAVPQNGVELKNLEPGALKLRYDDASHKLDFDRVTHSELKLFDTCKAELKSGENTTLLGVENWTSAAQAVALDWVVLIDDTYSMHAEKRGRCFVREALAYTKQMLETLSPQDSLCVYLVTNELKLQGKKVMGNDDAGKTELKNLLEELTRKATTRQPQRARTGMLYRLESMVNELGSAPRAEGRASTFVVLADDDEDHSREGTVNQLITAATQSGKEVVINALIYYNGANNGTYFVYDELCKKTNGMFYGMSAKADENRLVDMQRAMSRKLHRPHCRFSLTMPVDLAQKTLQLSFSMKEQVTGPVEITLAPEALQQLCAGAPLPADTVSAVNKAKELLAASAPFVTALAEAEQQNNAESIAEASRKVKEYADNLLPVCRTLKSQDAAIVKRAIDRALERPGLSEQERQLLQNIRAFVENAQITAQNLTSEHVLALMGRSTPLPPDNAEQPDANAQLLQRLLQSIETASADLAALKDLEAQQPQSPDLIAEKTRKMQEHIAAIKPICVEIKSGNKDALLAAVQANQRAENLSMQAEQTLLRVKQFIADDSITAQNVTDAHVLMLMGRDTPLPEIAESSETPSWVLWSIGGGSVLLVLALICCYCGYVRRVNRKKKKMKEEEARKREQEWKLMQEEQEQKMQAEQNEKAAIVSCIKSDESLPSGARVRARVVCEAARSEWYILGNLVIIGRSRTCDLVIPNSDNTVSGRHCTLSFRDGRWTLTDMNARNGIFANGRLHQKLELRSGMTVELGSVKLKFIIQN